MWKIDDNIETVVLRIEPNLTGIENTDELLFFKNYLLKDLEHFRLQFYETKACRVNSRFTDTIIRTTAREDILSREQLNPTQK